MNKFFNKIKYKWEAVLMGWFLFVIWFFPNGSEVVLVLAHLAVLAGLFYWTFKVWASKFPKRYESLRDWFVEEFAHDSSFEYEVDEKVREANSLAVNHTRTLAKEKAEKAKNESSDAKDKEERKDI